MRRFKSDDLLISVLPVEDVAKKFDWPRGKDCVCTPCATNIFTHNTTTTRFTVRVSKNDLATLRRVLSALQQGASKKK